MIAPKRNGLRRADADNVHAGYDGLMLEIVLRAVQDAHLQVKSRSQTVSYLSPTDAATAITFLSGMAADMANTAVQRRIITRHALKPHADKLRKSLTEYLEAP